jgi:hypothetical protein
MLTVLLWTLSACGEKPPVLTPPAPDCLELIEPTLGRPTPSATIPPTRTEGSLAAFADAQTGQLDIANGDKAEIFAFNRRCKAMVDKMRADLTARKKLLGVL